MSSPSPSSRKTQKLYPTSPSISTQGPDGTCYAHALARILVNAVRRTIPRQFYPLTDDCDDYFDYEKMRSIFLDNPVKNGPLSRSRSRSRSITRDGNKCSRKSFNNALLYVYFYFILKNEYGCKGTNTADALKWFVTKKLKMIARKEIIDAVFGKAPSVGQSPFLGFTSDHSDHIQTLCEKFIHKFYSDESNEMHSYAHEFARYSSYSDPSVILKDVSLFTYVLDQGYYIVISGNRHAMTVVDYEIIDRKFYLIVKYNQGKIRMFYKDANALIAEGVFKIELEDAVKRGFTRYLFVLPLQITEKEKAEIRKKSEDLRRKLDVADFMLRKKVVPNIISNALTNIVTRKSRSK